MSTTINLKHPIQLEGRELKSITLRRPKVADILRAKKASEDDAEQEVATVAALAGIPPAAVEDLDLADYKVIQKALAGFFG